MGSFASSLRETPALSVVLLVPGRRETVLRTLACMRAQSIQQRLELLLFGESLRVLEELQEEVAPFCGYQFVVWNRPRNLAAARAEGIRLARAPLVVHAEDHCFPEPGWAEALVAAFEPLADGRTPAAAGPLMVNENPRSLWSWAAFTLHFSHSAFTESHGPARYVATHNTCFRKEVLVALGGHLDSGIEMELLLQDRLRAEGHVLFHQSKAVTRHINISRPRASLIASFYGGWLFSTVRLREQQWTLGRRLFQLAVSPAVPLLQLKRRWNALRRIAPGHTLLPWVAVPVLLVALVHTLGEMTGILFPKDRVIEQYSDFENTRSRFVRLDELALLEPPTEPPPARAAST